MKLLSIIFLAIIVGFILPSTIRKFVVQRANNPVSVKVVKLPDCSAGARHKFIHIRHNGTTHIIRTRCKYVSGLTIGQQTQMLHNNGTDIYLFPNEDVRFELVLMIVLALIAAAILVKSIKGS